MTKKKKCIAGCVQGEFIQILYKIPNIIDDIFFIHQKGVTESLTLLFMFVSGRLQSNQPIVAIL